MARNKVYSVALVIVFFIIATNFNIYPPITLTIQASGTLTPAVQVITATNAQRLAKFTVITPATSGDVFGNPIWSPDGSRLALSGSKGIEVFNVSDFTKPQQIIIQDTPANVSFSPDSQLLAVLNANMADRSVHVFDLGTGKELYSLQNEALSFQISPDGKLLAVHAYDGTINLFDLHTGEHKASLDGNQIFFAFGPNNSIITIEQAQQGYINAVWLWNISTGQRVKKWERNSNPISIASSPKNNTFAVSYSDNIVLFDFSTNVITQTLMTGGLEKQLINLLFNADATLLASFGSGKIYLWQLLTQKTIAEFDNLDPDLYGASFNTDSSLLIYWDYDSQGKPSMGDRTRLWSISEHKEIIVLPDAHDPQISPDGSMLATWGENGVTIWSIQ